ncbi:MAG: hypothetical protein LJE93_03560 [Acidobacteria bacterium]|nr:hypothetical protein [Acidobacteriota bacterium]
MASDSKLPVVIFGVLVALIAIPFLLAHLREQRRPLLIEARVVTASAADPVFREGERHIPAGESVEAAVALRFGRRGEDGRWMSPIERLVIDGRNTDHERSGTWPEAGRSLRVFWFSVECANLGGALTAENARERLEYRTFLAPEMGRGLLAERLPEAHNDDHVGPQQVPEQDIAGTVRLYARVELVEAEDDVRPLQAVTTLGSDAIFDPKFPSIYHSADLGDGIDGSVGELFRLPGFEPRSETGPWNDVTVAAFGRPFTDLVSERLVVSSRTLASVAVSGSPDLDPADLASLGRLEVTTDKVTSRGGTLHWGTEVNPGDLLVEGDRWRVLLEDDGNGDLDPADAVLHCWGRPPEMTTLWASLENETATMELMRHER